MSILTRQNRIRSKSMLRLCCLIHTQKEIDLPRKKCYILSQYFSSRLLHSTQNLTKKGNVDIKSTTKSIKALPVSKHYTEITNYFQSKECLAEIFPKLQGRYIRRRYKYPDSQFLVDKEIAVELIDAIKSDLIKDDSHIFELNPGPGVITKQLLLNNINKLHIFEGPAIKVIGALTPTVSGNLIKYITYSIIFQNGLITYGRPELYLFMQPITYLQMTSSPESGYLLYRSISVIFNLFFETKLLKKIPRNALVPWCCKYVAKRNSKLFKFHAVDADQMYFVKITARQDLLSVIRPDMLKPFWYFLRYHMLSRKNRVIPMLERWIPGCGPRLIAEGLTIFTEFGDLYPHELLSIFKLFISWPEFNSCPFLASMETALLKMEMPGNEDVLEEEDVDVEEEIEAEKKCKKSKS